MKSFIRFFPPPIIEGYDEPALPVPCPTAGKYEFQMPIKGGDLMRFILNVEDTPVSEGATGKLGLINGDCENVSYEIGLYDTSTDNRQRAFTVNFPLLPIGCYRFVWYEETYSSMGPDVIVATSCLTDGSGNNTGFQQQTIENEATGLVRTPIAISNPLTLIPDYDRNTKIVQYSGSGIDYGYNYDNFPDFFHYFRLPVTIAEQSHEVSTKEYRQTNGRFRRGNTYIDKKIVLNTEYFDDATHDAFANVLYHDNVTIDGVEYFATGDYAPKHQETALVPDRFHPMWPASIEMKLQGYNQQNNACDLEPSEFKIYNDVYTDVYA